MLRWIPCSSLTFYLYPLRHGRYGSIHRHIRGKIWIILFIHFIADIIVLVSSSAKAFIRLHIAGSPKDGEGIQREAGCADLHRIAAGSGLNQAE